MLQVGVDFEPDSGSIGDFAHRCAAHHATNRPDAMLEPVSFIEIGKTLWIGDPFEAFEAVDNGPIRAATDRSNLPHPEAESLQVQLHQRVRLPCQRASCIREQRQTGCPQK